MTSGSEVVVAPPARWRWADQNCDSDKEPAGRWDGDPGQGCTLEFMHLELEWLHCSRPQNQLMCVLMMRVTGTKADRSQSHDLHETTTTRTINSKAITAWTIICLIIGIKTDRVIVPMQEVRDEWFLASEATTTREQGGEVQLVQVSNTLALRHPRFTQTAHAMACADEHEIW